MYLRHIDVNIVLWAAVVCEQYSPDLTRISNCECFFQHYSVCRQLERIDVGRLFFSRAMYVVYINLFALNWRMNCRKAYFLFQWFVDISLYN